MPHRRQRTPGRLTRRRRPRIPVPPIEMPPARTVRIPDRGEFFVRDTGGEGPPVMLLHGWMASGDLNWWPAYAALVEAGYRVLAIDHRGHGRGLRPVGRFRLADCAADVAAVLTALEAAPAVVVGYSMGGAIAQLLARDHADVIDGVVLSGTSQHWQDPASRRYFKTMLFLGLTISLAPKLFWRWGLWQMGMREGELSIWIHSELMRHSARDIAEAGRELGRFDSRPWLGAVALPAAVVVTTRDELVPVRNQRALAEAARARVFEAPITHLELGARGDIYNPQLLAAIAAVRDRPAAPGPEAAASGPQAADEFAAA
jgi:pimeloyl-ACP methyl ester carboxylesterase